MGGGANRLQIATVRSAGGSVITVIHLLLNVHVVSDASHTDIRISVPLVSQLGVFVLLLLTS
jgi:hypothetical protein